MSVQKITEGEMAALGVSSLPNRPSAPSLYSGEALTAAELRAAFDRLPRLLAARFNALLDAAGLYGGKTGADTLAALIATGLEEGHSLEDLFSEIPSGVLAHRLSVDGVRTLPEVLSQLTAALTPPEGFSDLRSYVDAPAGEVRKGDGRPVSGDRVETALRTALTPLDSRVRVIEEALDGMPFYFTTQITKTGESPVPDLAFGYARLDSISGISRPCTNLFRYAYGDALSDEGTLATVGEDGRVYLYRNAPVKATFSLRAPTYTGGVYSASLRLVSGTPLPSSTDGKLYLEIDGIGRIDAACGFACETHGATAVQIGHNLTLHGDWRGCALEVTVNSGEALLPFTPYRPVLTHAACTAVCSYAADGTLLDSYEIPEALRAQRDYGIGVAEVAENEIDFRARTYARRASVGRPTASSSYDGGYGIVFRTNGLWNRPGYLSSVCSHAQNLKELSYRAPYEGCYGVYSDQGAYSNQLFRPLFRGMETEKDFAAFVAEQKTAGTPLTLVSALREEQASVTDLSAHIPHVPYLRVEGGGRVVALCEGGGTAGLTVTYQIKTRPYEE